MSVRDVIKKSILELTNLGSTFTPDIIISTILALILAVVFGLFIHFVYTKFYRGVVYNRNFSITLVGMTILTAMVTLAISTNIVISLGMVGALSIVRFRTAIKDPLDLLYLFWAITAGITIGAYMYPLAFIASAILFIVILIMTRKSIGKSVYIAIVQYTGEQTSDDIRSAMTGIDFRVKSQTARREFTELAMEIHIKGNDLSFIDKIRAIPGVEEATAIQYDGEYHG